MPAGTIFLNNRSQAVRLPKAVAFPKGVTKVAIEVVGDTRVLTPVATTWLEWAANRRGHDATFMAVRDQGSFDDRDWGE